MIFNSFLPAKPLAPFVKGYRIIESKTDFHKNSLLPDTALTMALVHHGRVSQTIDNEHIVLPNSTIAGLVKKPRRVAYDPHTTNLVILFKDMGASAFTKFPLHELANHAVYLGGIFNEIEIKCLHEQLADAKTNELKTGMVNQFLLAHLSTKETDKLVAEAIKYIYAAKGNILIGALIKQLHISTDAFEKRFRKVVGTSPKQFATTVRMKTILQEKTPSENFLDLALDAGFYDQAHFIHEFKAFTGQTPSTYFQKTNQ